MKTFTQYKNLYIKITNVIFTLCGTMLAIVQTAQSGFFILQATGGDKVKMLGWLCVVAVFTLTGLSVLTFKYNFIENTWNKLRENGALLQILFAVFAILCAWCFVEKFHENEHTQSLLNHLLYAYGKVTEPLPNTSPVLQWLPSVTTFIPVTVFYFFISTASAAMFIPAAVFYFFISMAFVDAIKGIVTTLDKVERRFLIIGFAVAVLYIVVLYNLSNAYYAPMYPDCKGDVLFDTDSASYLLGDVFGTITHYENDLRQPLFAVFAFPLSYLMPAHFSFLVRAEIIGVVQFILNFLVMLMLSRLMKLDAKAQIIFFLLYSATFPIIIYSSIIEQYAIPLFWMILFIYSYFENSDRAVWFSAASGSLITSAWCFPLLIKSKETWFADLLKGAGIFLLILALSGRIAVIIDILPQLEHLSVFSAENWTFYAKFLHYLEMCRSVLVIPNFENNKSEIYMSQINSVDIIGIAVLLAVIFGFLLNYKNRFAQICFAQILLSFYVIAIKGWGVNKNSVTLYSLYFSWAYISLIHMAIDKLLREKTKHIALGLLIAVCLYVNVCAAIDILRFGIEYYPVR